MYAQYLIYKIRITYENRGNGTVVFGVLIGGVPDNESGFHTQGWVLTQKNAVSRGGVRSKKYVYVILYE